MSTNNIKMNGDIYDVYQISLKNELKSKFMESGDELALNPSAVLRMLMDEWTHKAQIEKKLNSIQHVVTHNDRKSFTHRTVHADQTRQL